jgi:hypothetical protein
MEGHQRKMHGVWQKIAITINLRYIHVIVDYGLEYKKIDEFRNFRLTGYTNAGWVGCVDDRKLTSSFSFQDGSATSSWHNKK